MKLKGFGSKLEVILQTLQIQIPLLIYREKALAVTNFKGVEPAMEWLLAHGEDFGSSSSGHTVGGAVGAGSSNSAPAVPTPVNETTSTSTEEAEAKSLRCDECGKLFKNQEEVEFHAAKTNHSSFSESTEEKKPLTEEEKKAQLVLLEERLKLKRKEREDREKVCVGDHSMNFMVIFVSFSISCKQKS